MPPPHLEHAITSIAEEQALHHAEQVTIRRAAGPDDLDCVYRMTHNAYVDLGFIAPRPDGRLNHYPHLDRAPETTVLLAELDGKIVGTNSFTLDGPAGLHVDEDFREATDRVRAEGRRIASSWRINTSKTIRDHGEVVRALIRETLRLVLAAEVRTCLFIFNKRHERIYARMLNMTTIAELASIRCVDNFPAVLMRCDDERLPAWCRQAC